MRNVANFDPAKLNHVETEEKVVLPSIEGKLLWLWSSL